MVARPALLLTGMIRHALSSVLWMFAAILLATVAQAAELTGVQHDKTVTIRVSGDIADGDFDKFAAIAALYPQAQVNLSSSGGSIEDALQIGEMIHQKGYTTIVADGSTHKMVDSDGCCFSWNQRYMGYRCRNTVTGNNIFADSPTSRRGIAATEIHGAGTS
jgi:hypothetical protein